MKQLVFCLAVFIAVLSAAAQSASRMVDGQVYSISDSSAWTVFNDRLKVKGFSTNGVVCQCYKTETVQTGTHKLAKQTTPLYGTRTILGQTIILKNYPGQKNLTLGSDIPPPIKAIRVGESSVPRSVSGSVLVHVLVYDMGVPYTPPARVLTPAEKEVQAKRQIQTQSKTIEWLQTQAANGSASAQCSLGLRYLEGRGLPKDEALGRQWLGKAAAQGNAEAASKLKEIAAVQTGSNDSATNSESSLNPPK